MMPGKTDIQTNTNVSVVIPVYNSGECLQALLEKLSESLDKLNRSYEIILVNDGSKDGSWKEITRLSQKYGKLKGINFRKNFGQDNALMAGLKFSCGDIVIIMDDDLQHNPEDIPSLVAKIDDGYDVCYAHFTSKKQSLFKNFGSWFNGKMANIVIKKPDDVYLSPYKAISNGIVREILKYDGPFPYVDGLIFDITRNITQIPATHYKRYAGKSNYNFIRSINVWLRLTTNFSIFPLRISTFVGFIFAAFSFILAIIFILTYYLGGPSPSGWASMIVSMLFLGGVQLFVVGIIGEYIGRLALYTNKKPQFVIEKSIGFTHTDSKLPQS